MKLIRTVLAAFLTLTLSVTPSEVSAEWRQFRGPGSAGKSEDAGLPLKWSPTKNVAWRVELGGYGSSSPIIVGDRVFVTSYGGYGLDAERPGKQADLALRLHAYELATGKEVWTRKVAPVLPEHGYDDFLPEHGYASGTPVSDGEAVFCYFGKSGLHAFSVEGKFLWSAITGSGTHRFGSGTSPLLFNDLVIVNAFVESGSIHAYNKRSGDNVWSTGGLSDAWCTPVLVDVPGGKPEVVISNEGPLLGLDPESGKKLWSCEGIDDYVCPSVVSHNGVVYALGGRRSVKAVAVRAGGRGEITKTHRLWKSKEGSKVPSPVYHEGHLYFVQHTGIAYCVEAATGKVIYKKRLEGLGSDNKTYASVHLAGKRLYAVTCYGGTFVLEAAPKFRQLAHNRLADNTAFNASPAISGKRLLLRSDRALYCLTEE